MNVGPTDCVIARCALRRRGPCTFRWACCACGTCAWRCGSGCDGATWRRPNKLRI